jgi:dTDP-4-amino-4,6-dideoxygalactose transaminase
MIIPPFKYYFPEESIEWISETIAELLRSDSYLSMGKYCEQFENEFAEMVGTKYAVTTASGVAALDVALRAKGITGGEVVVPTNTFGASALAVINSGATPVYCDISSDMNIDFEDMKKRITSKTKAVMPVHIGGIISKSIEEIREFCKTRNIVVLEDAAHAHGSKFGRSVAGSIGDLAAFSFFTTKIITSGEGGMVVTSEYESYEKAKQIRSYNKVAGSEIGELGYNWRLSEFQAIIGLAQLRKLGEILEKRRRVAKTYDDLLKSSSVYLPLESSPTCIPSYYKYIRLLSKRRNPSALHKLLETKYGVSLSGYVYDVPLHRQKMLGQYATNKKSYPTADDLCSRHICLPIYPQMEEKEIHHVFDSLSMAAKDLGWNN